MYLVMECDEGGLGWVPSEVMMAEFNDHGPLLVMNRDMAEDMLRRLWHRAMGTHLTRMGDYDGNLIAEGSDHLGSRAFVARQIELFA